jgi:hypothetical protein
MIPVLVEMIWLILILDEVKKDRSENKESATCKKCNTTIVAAKSLENIERDKYKIWYLRTVRRRQTARHLSYRYSVEPGSRLLKLFLVWVRVAAVSRTAVLKATIILRRADECHRLIRL